MINLIFLINFIEYLLNQNHRVFKLIIMSQISDYDILIIGAGPAGSTAAILAAKKGYRVAIIDRSIFPRDKVCGDQIILNALDVLVKENIDLTPLMENSIMTGCLEYITDKEVFSFDLRESPIKSLSCKRELFDNFLFSEAHKLVSDCYQGIKDLNIQGEAENYAVSFNCDGKAQTISTKYIIGSDGASSFVRRNYFKGLDLSNAIATRSYVKYTGNKVFMRGYYFHEIENGGYFWIFPVNENTANCGVIVFTDHWKQHFKTLSEVHFHYAGKLKELISYPETMDTWQTPFLLSEQDVVNGNVLLAGDAAGLVNPMFGHGIDAAIISSKVAIDHIDKHIKDKNYNLNNYSKEIYNLFASKYAIHEQFRNDGMKVDEGFGARLQNYFAVKENVTLS